METAQRRWGASLSLRLASMCPAPAATKKIVTRPLSRSHDEIATKIAHRHHGGGRDHRGLREWDAPAGRLWLYHVFVADRVSVIQGRCRDRDRRFSRARQSQQSAVA